MENKIIIITGGANGLGYELVKDVNIKILNVFLNL